MKELWLFVEGGNIDGEIRVSLVYDDISYDKIINNEYRLFMPFHLFKANEGLALVNENPTPKQVLREVIREIKDNELVKTNKDYSFDSAINLCLSVLEKYMNKYP